MLVGAAAPSQSAAACSGQVAQLGALEQRCEMENEGEVRVKFAGCGDGTTRGLTISLMSTCWPKPTSSVLSSAQCSSGSHACSRRRAASAVAAVRGSA